MERQRPVAGTRWSDHRQRAWDAAYNNQPSLTPQEHVSAMTKLRALNSDPEQVRRAERIVEETKELPLRLRIVLGREMLITMRGLPAHDWDVVFELRVREQLQLVAGKKVQSLTPPRTPIPREE